MVQKFSVVSLFIDKVGQRTTSAGAECLFFLFETRPKLCERKETCSEQVLVSFAGQKRINNKRGQL